MNKKAPHRISEQHLTVLSWSAPLLAQLIMLIVMCMQRHWLYAAMLAPSLLGSALMLITMIMRVRHEETNSNTITGSDSPVPTHHNGNEIDHAQLFADMPSISFEHLHGLDNDPLIWRTIVRNWLVRSPTSGIGMSEHGIFHIDLASSGPHAMVAGTTGSGKSELLISWCMALAIRHSPQTLHFIFLDFKGGSTFNALERLPHTVGNVCDLDLAHAVRALNAIEQELARREALVSPNAFPDSTSFPIPLHGSWWSLTNSMHCATVYPTICSDSIDWRRSDALWVCISSYARKIPWVRSMPI